MLIGFKFSYLQQGNLFYLYKLLAWTFMFFCASIFHCVSNYLLVRFVFGAEMEFKFISCWVLLYLCLQLDFLFFHLFFLAHLFQCLFNCLSSYLKYILEAVCGLFSQAHCQWDLGAIKFLSVRSMFNRFLYAPSKEFTKSFNGLGTISLEHCHPLCTWLKNRWPYFLENIFVQTW